VLNYSVCMYVCYYTLINNDAPINVKPLHPQGWDQSRGISLLYKANVLLGALLLSASYKTIIIRLTFAMENKVMAVANARHIKK